MDKIAKIELVVACDVCGSKKYKSFIEAPDRNYKTGTFTYVQCIKCKLVWLNPRPSKNSILNYYPKVYRAYKPNVTNLNILQRFVRSSIMANNFIAKLLVKDPLFFIKKGKLLDVGCGSGKYLNILKGWGWKTYGVEINSKAAFWANKINCGNVETGDLFSGRYKSNYFNVVRFSHVLEHVPSPTAELKETRRILKKNGHVVIQIPNIDSLFFNIFRSNWYQLDAPRHLYHFSSRNLTKLLKKTGFRNIRITYQQSPYSLYRSLLYLNNKSNVETRNYFITIFGGLFIKILNPLHVSDMLYVTARK